MTDCLQLSAHRAVKTEPPVIFDWLSVQMLHPPKYNWGGKHTTFYDTSNLVRFFRDCGIAIAQTKIMQCRPKKNTETSFRRNVSHNLVCRFCGIQSTWQCKCFPSFDAIPLALGLLHSSCWGAVKPCAWDSFYCLLTAEVVSMVWKSRV